MAHHEKDTLALAKAAKISAAAAVDAAYASYARMTDATWTSDYPGAYAAIRAAEDAEDAALDAYRAAKRAR